MNQSLQQYQYEEVAGIIDRAIRALTPQRFKKFENKVKNNLQDVKEPVIERSVTKLEKTIKSTVKNKKSATIAAKLNEDYGEQTFKDAAKELREVYFEKGKLNKELLNSDLRQYEKNGKIYRLDFKPEYKKMHDQVRKKLGEKKYKNFQKALAEAAHSEQEVENLIKSHLSDNKVNAAIKGTLIASTIAAIAGYYTASSPETSYYFSYLAVWAYAYLPLYGIAFLVGGLAIVGMLFVLYKNLAKLFIVLSKILLNKYLAYALTITGAVYLIVKIAANWTAIWGTTSALASSLSAVLLTVNSTILIWVIGGTLLSLIVYNIIRGIAIKLGYTPKTKRTPKNLMSLSSITTYEDLIPSNPEVKLVNY